MFTVDENKVRNVPLDALRIIAIFMVISLHITPAWKYGNCYDAKWFIAEAFDAISICAVPLFL